MGLSAAVTEDPDKANSKEIAAWALSGAGVGGATIGFTLVFASEASVEIVPGLPGRTARLGLSSDSVPFTR